MADDSAEDRASKLAKCRALDKMKRGELHSISLNDAQELFDVLDVSERGELSEEDLRVLGTIPDLSLTAADMDGLIKDCTKDSGGKISVMNLYNSFHQGSLVERAILEELGQGPKVYNTHECTRDELLDFLEHENETQDALCSLPITIVAFALFFVLVQFHLEIKVAYAMQSAIFEEVEGEGKPFIGTYIHDVPSFWEWMRTSFVGAQFKSSKEKLRQYPYPGRFAVYNQIIGGTQIVKTQSNGLTSCGSANFGEAYDSLNGGMCHKGGEANVTSEFLVYHLQSNEIINHLNYLDDLNWVDQNTRSLDFVNLYYNAHLSEFTDFHLTFDWDPAGNVRILYSMESWVADPYKHIWLVGVDIIYIIILARMFYQESQEMLPRLMNGLDGFIQYWEFWNVVDWLNIAFGAVFFVMWGMIVAAVTGPLQEAINALPTKELDNWVVGNQTYFEAAQLEAVIPQATYTEMIAKVHTQAAECAGMHGNLRTVTFYYNFTLMLKFFKAFRANPRLNIVIMTIQDASVDIIHFFLVFMTIFLVFSMMAATIFGPKMKEFHTQIRSFLYCWRILLGDFDVEEMEGVNYGMANLWFLGFQVMVMMILLNMLLAIIMDTYSSVVGKGGNKTIWAQVREAVNTVRETRGHLGLLYIRCEMEDEDQKAHPGERVNSKSLRKAFERDKMTRGNADYLVRKTVEFLQEKAEECELRMHDAVKLVGQTKTMVLKISDDTTKTLAMLQATEDRPRLERQEAIMAGYDPDDHAQLKEFKQCKEQDAIIDLHHHPAAPATNNMPGMVNHNMPPTGLPGMANQQNQQIYHDPDHIPDPRELLPFQAANHQNALALTASTGLSGASTTMPLQITNGSPQNSMMAGSNGFNQSGISNMQSTGGAAAMMNTSSHSIPPDTMAMIQQMQMQINANAAGISSNAQGVSQNAQTAAGGGGNMNQVLDKLNRIDQKMSQMQEQVADQRNYIEQRDSWLETRMSQLDRRCQKVEVLSDRLYTHLKSFDVNDLAQVPREVKKALDMHFEKMDGMASPPGSPTTRALRDAAGALDPSSPPARLPGALADLDLDYEEAELGISPNGPSTLAVGHAGADHHGHHHGEQNAAMMHDIREMTMHMQTLVSHAEATPQITRLLWRMDLNLRQLTGSASNIAEEAGHHSPLKSSPSKDRAKAMLNRGGAGPERSPSKDRNPSRGNTSSAGASAIPEDSGPLAYAGGHDPTTGKASRQSTKFGNG